MLTSTTARNDYALNGATLIYPYTFRIFAAVDLQVIRRSATTGLETVLAYPADFAVSGVGNTSGGSVTLVSAGTNGDLLTVRRNAALTQAFDLANQGRYAPADIEAALDRVTAIAQQQQDQLDRSVKLPPSYAPGARNVVLKPVTGQVVTGDASGGFTMATIATAAAVALPGQGRTVTTLSAYLANNAVFNVDDYGADSSGVLDSSLPIQAAINAADPVAGIVYFNGPAYKMIGITWSGIPRLQGGGMGRTTITASAAGTMISCVKTALVPINGYIADMRLDGNNVGTIGVRLKAIAQFNLTRLDIRSFTAKNLDCEGAITFEANACRFLGSQIGADFYTAVGISPANLVKLRDCVIQANTTWGVRVNGGSLFAMEKCDLENNGTVADDTTGALFVSNMGPNGEGVACSITESWFEGNRGYAAIRIDAPANPIVRHVIERTLIIAGNRKYGIKVSGATRYNLKDVVAQNATLFDIEDAATSIGEINDCSCSTANLLGTATSYMPHPLGTGITRRVGKFTTTDKITVPAGGLEVTAGNVGIGAANIPQAGLYMTGPLLSGNAAQFGALVGPTFSTAATTFMRGLDTQVISAAGAYVTPEVTGHRIRDMSKGAGHTVTTQVGLLVEAQTGGGTNYAVQTLGTTPAQFGGSVGFNGAVPVAKPAIAGSRAGNAALASLLTALAATGILTDSTTP